MGNYGADTSILRTNVDTLTSTSWHGWTGMGVSQGTARGIAKSPDDPTFAEGDILVAHMTLPKHIPQMRLASGIATDIGSATCHAAIHARELGKPCVVATGSATSLEGQEVEIDVGGYDDAHIVARHETKGDS